MSDEQKKLIEQVKRLAFELGKCPTRVQFEQSTVGGKYQLEKHFGTFQNLILKAGLISAKEIVHHQENTEKILKNYLKLCSKKEQIHGFFVHKVELKDLFTRAGNPKVLKVSAMPDTHVKYRDKAAVKCYMKFLEYYKPDVHMIMGDFIDCEGLSHWPADTLEPRRIVPEIVEGRKLIQEIVDITKGCSSRIFLTGNHEHWIDQALNKMPELFDGLQELGIDVSLKNLLGLDKFNYELFEVNHLVKIGKAHFTHGIYAGNAHAKKHLDVFKSNIFYGHLHDVQCFNQTSMEGPMTAQSLGTLARLDAKFLKGKPNNWVQAHGVFEFFPDGNFTYYVPNIINGKMSFNGQIFDGNV